VNLWIDATPMTSGGEFPALLAGRQLRFGEGLRHVGVSGIVSNIGQLYIGQTQWTIMDL
jgi:hypothetical protein